MRTLFSCLLLFLYYLGATAQEYVVDIKHWDVKAGLPHRQVSDIYQDRSGMIWLATPQGLSRFDGYHFLNYTKEKNGLLSTKVDIVAEDAMGRLWLLSHEKPYCYFIFDPISGKASSVQQVTGDTIRQYIWGFKTMADSSVLIETEDRIGHTYYSWHPRTGLHKWIIPKEYQVMCTLPERNCIMAENDSNEIMQVSLDGKIIKKKKAPFLKGSIVSAFQVDYRYVSDNATHKVYRVSPDLDISELGGIARNASYNIFEIFSAGKDDISFLKNKFVKPGCGVIYELNERSFPGAEGTYRMVIKDNKNRMWIGNDFGLNLLTINRNKFKHYYNDTSQKGYVNTCRGLYPWGRYLYVCSEFWGLFRIDLLTHETKRMFRIFSYSMCKISDGLLMGNICRMDDRGNAKYFSNDFITKAGNSWCFYEYAPHLVLVGVPGLAWFNDTTGNIAPFEKYNGYDGLKKAQVLYIAKDKNGQIWLCCDNGFYTLDIGKGITGRYSADDTGAHFLPASDFRHFYQDSDGDYWIATASGLIKWDKQKQTSKLYTQTDGLSNNNLYAVYGDRGGNLWMSSDYGIIRLNRQTGVTRTYTTEDGVSNNEFNRPSHYQDDTGKIYFGSLDGVNVFDPRDFESDSEAQKNASALVITSFLQFNGVTNKLEDKRADLISSNTIKMYPQDRFFTLEVVLLNFDNVTQTNYYWKIDGIDTGWNVQNDRTLRFSRLPYDTHVLHIKAQAADGSWSRNEIAININVLRPFYLQMWFLIVSLVAVVMLVIMGYNWRLYLLRRENDRLDKVVKEKTNDLRISLHQKDILLKEIHHRVKNNLQVISSLLRLQSHSVKDEAAKNALLEGQNRVMSIALIHQKLYQDEQLDVVEFAAFADELFDQLRTIFDAGIGVAFINEMPETFLTIDVAVPLGLILNELVTNSFKYAFKNGLQPKIWLNITDSGDLFTVIYADSGIGLPNDLDIEHSKSLGLRLVSRLSKQLGGKVIYTKSDRSSFMITIKKEAE